MKAVIYDGIEQVRCAEVADPVIVDPGDVVLEVHHAGLCGSDLHVYFGREQGLDAGTVMGHEVAGRIVALGSGVRRFREGDLVVAPFSTNCGECFFCKEGIPARCERGKLFGWVEKGAGLHGAQAEYLRVPLADGSLVRIADGVDPEAALLTGDILSTGFFCADMAGITPRGVYVVVGCGPVGIMTSLAARCRGAETIIALDLDPRRREFAARFGITALDPGDPSARERIFEISGGRGADAVMEAVGSGAAAKTGFDLLRPGGTLAICGVHTEPRFPFSPVDAYNRNLTLKIGRCPARRYMDETMEALAGKKIVLDGFVSHRFSLAEGAEAYRMFAAREVTKGIFNPR